MNFEKPLERTQLPSFSVQEGKIVQKLRRRKETSLHVVPPIFTQKQPSFESAETRKKPVQRAKILGAVELPIVSKQSEKQQDTTKKKTIPSSQPKQVPSKITRDLEIEIEKRRNNIAPEIIQRLKKVKEYSFREAPQLSKHRQRLIRELQSGNKTRLGASLQVF